MPTTKDASFSWVSLAFVLYATTYATTLNGQSVEPLISEYVDHASGSFDVVNHSMSPSVVQIDPKSFSIALDGTGEFRPLDPSIHLELSTTSLRLEPMQTAHVFYKVTADTVPAWLCIYASFSSLKKSSGINVRVMLPHTVYLYQKQPLQKETIALTDVKYDASTHRITGELMNNSLRAGRAESVEVKGNHSFTSEGGFPMLPHQRRLLSIEWPSDQKPSDVSIEFEHFAIKSVIAD